MSLATSTAAKVVAAIQTVGISATLTQTTETFDPATSSTVETGSTAHTVTINDPLPVEMRLIESTSLQIGDAVAYMAASGAPTTPAIGDTLAASGRTWSVVRVVEYPMAGTLIAWELFLRGGAT